MGSQLEFRVPDGGLRRVSGVGSKNLDFLHPPNLALAMQDSDVP